MGTEPYLGLLPGLGKDRKSMFTHVIHSIYGMHIAAALCCLLAFNSMPRLCNIPTHIQGDAQDLPASGAPIRCQMWVTNRSAVNMLSFAPWRWWEDQQMSLHLVDPPPP